MIGRGRHTDESFAAFVTARSGRLIGYAELLCGDRDQARDIVQTVLTRAYPRWRHIEHEDPYGYLCRAVTNAVTDWWRTAHRRREQPAGELPEQAVSDHAATFENRQTLLAALGGLTARERAVVVLRYLDDHAEREVAELLGISVGTVKSTCHKALGKMRIAVAEPAPLTTAKQNRSS
ncbi:SigE family RNA polymerase sigma factor [Actinoplanes nipponensis]|uniref:DNA-directed RNA polymerase sigma-70 factor n=2 Tax=Actinoplanes nipponensis TaxID=135950 RepID=A0A919JHE6_9ACTN|nr:DNA-directed RNA polymerase sigma-70 factor [Actinoplanes nipponensis]